MKSATYYLNNIIDFADNAAIIRRRKVYYDKEKIKNCIQDLIDNNMEYILSDSFLYYLVILSLPVRKDITEELCKNLETLKKDPVIIVDDLLWGYALVLSDFRFLNNKYSNIMGEPDEILMFRDDFEREIHEVYKEYVNKMTINYKIDRGFQGTFDVIVLHLLGLAIYKQDINVFREKMQPYLDDPVKELDNMYFNDILYKDSYPERFPVLSTDYYRVTDYIINKDHNKKSIK